MLYIIPAIGFLTGLWGILFWLWQRKKIGDQYKIVSISPVYLLLCIGGLVMFGILVIMCLHIESAWFLKWPLEFWELLFAFSVIKWCASILLFDRNQLIKIDLLGRWKKYDYCQVVKITKKSDYTIWLKKGKIKLSWEAENKGRLISTIFVRKKELDPENRLEYRVLPYRLFKNKIEKPGELVFAYGSIIAMVIWTVLIIIANYVQDTDIDNMKRIEVTIFGLGLSEGDFSFTCEGIDTRFVFDSADRYVAGYEELKQFKSGMDVIVFSGGKESKDHQMKIWGLESIEGKVYITYEEHYNSIINECIPFWITWGIFSLIILIYILLSVYLLCNAEKYPRLVRHIVDDSKLK